MAVVPLEYEIITVNLDQPNADRRILDTGRLFNSFWIAQMTAGLTVANMRLGDKQQFPISAGLNLAWGGCQAERDGLYITTSPAIPGGRIVIMVGNDIESGS